MLEKVMQKIQKIIKHGTQKGANNHPKTYKKSIRKQIGKLNIWAGWIHDAGMATGRSCDSHYSRRYCAFQGGRHEGAAECGNPGTSEPGLIPIPTTGIRLHAESAWMTSKGKKQRPIMITVLIEARAKFVGVSCTGIRSEGRTCGQFAGSESARHACRQHVCHFSLFWRVQGYSLQHTIFICI